MSRAFVKEDGPDNAPLPDLAVSPHPNLVTPRGLAFWRREGCTGVLRTPPTRMGQRTHVRIRMARPL